MTDKRQEENRAFQEMLQAAVRRLQDRSGEDIAAKVIGSVIFSLIVEQKEWNTYREIQN